MREAVSRANNFANACTDVVIEGIKQGIPVARSHVWTLAAACVTFIRLFRTRTGVNLVADFEDARPFWSWNLQIPAVLPTCHPRGRICSWSELAHQHCRQRLQSARATGNPSIPWRLRDSIASWFLSVWEQNALCYHRTKARVAWKVVLYFSNRASICSHALILLSPPRWFVMTGGAPASVYSPLPNTFGLWSWSAHAHQSPAWSFKHVWMGFPCSLASISLEPKWLRLTWITPCKWCLLCSSPVCRTKLAILGYSCAVSWGWSTSSMTMPSSTPPPTPSPP